MKIAGTYQSIIQGVSQQAPENRRPGQMTEQVNLLPDPVNGLMRRPGSKLRVETPFFLQALYPALSASNSSYRAYQYTHDNNDYTIIYRADGGYGPLLTGLNATTHRFKTLVTSPSDTQTNTLSSGGISAIASVGKYLLIAGNSIFPQGSTTEYWDTPTNKSRSVLWVRGGSYSRKFEVVVSRTALPDVTLTYTTPTAAYPGVLDTSKIPTEVPDTAGGTSVQDEFATISAYTGAGGPTNTFYRAELAFFTLSPSALSVKRGATALTNIFPSATFTGGDQYSWDSANPQYIYLPFHIDYDEGRVEGVNASYTTTKTKANPQYTKQINDLTAAYNQAVNQWIATAAAAIQPEAIAQQLYDLAVSAGLTVSKVGSHLRFDGVSGVEAKDGGDGTFVRVVGHTVDNIDDVTLFHDVGHVVKVVPNNGAEAFYLRAVAKVDGNTGFSRVQWVEGQANSKSITGGLFIGIVSGDNVYLASSASILNSLLPGTHPEFNVSTVGDNDTSPMPSFVGRKVTYLGVFQDRLLIGAGSVLSVSATSDYFNFFRKSVLTVPADDAFEMTAQAAADDEIRFSVLHDRTLLLFGHKRQYAVNGKIPLTPTSANISVVSSHEGAGTVQPVVSGGAIFYMKQANSSASLWQMEPGDVADAQRSFCASNQVDSYISGTVLQVIATATPAVIIVRTTTGLYVYHYIDTQEGRQQAAWHKFEYAPECGVLLAVASSHESFSLIWLRPAYGFVWYVEDEQSLRVDTDTIYLDSARPFSLIDGTLRASTGPSCASVNPATLMGDILPELSKTNQYGYAAMTVGAMFDSYVVPTNPLPRDKNDKMMRGCRMTIGAVYAAFEDTGPVGFTVNGEQYADTGFILGESPFGRVPVNSRQVSMPIGYGFQDYSLKVHSELWYPMKITSFSWVGQLFNRTQRM